MPVDIIILHRRTILSNDAIIVSIQNVDGGGRKVPARCVGQVPPVQNKASLFGTVLSDVLKSGAGGQAKRFNEVPGEQGVETAILMTRQLLGEGRFADARLAKYYNLIVMSHDFYYYR